MTSTINSDQRNAWETYVSAWREASAEGKRAALKRCAAPDCVYQDPLTFAEGQEALVDYMLAFHQQVPGGHFITNYFLAHHDASIAKWNMVNGEGATIGEGVSYGQYNQQGALIAMTGFFETPAR